MSEKSELLLALEVLQKLSWFSFNGEAVQADCLKIERNIDKHFAKNKKQATIKDSFKLQYQYGVQIHTFKSSNTFFVFVYSICAIFIPSVIRIFAILNKISGLLRARNNERLLYNILKTPIPLSFRISKLTRW